MRIDLKRTTNRAKNKGNPSKARISRSQTILLVLLICVGLASSILLYIVISRREQAKIKNDFEIAAQERISIFKDHLEDSMNSLHWIAGLFNTAQKVKRSEFRELTRFYLLEHPEIQALEWIPRVPDSERTAYEAAARKDLLTDFNFTEQNQNQIVRAAKREEYFPVYFIEPYKGNEAALGFDLASNSVRLEALKSACDNNQLTATERILVQEDSEQPNEQYSIIVIQPIYQIGTPKDSIEQRRENLKGFVLVKLKISSFLESLLFHFEPFGMDIYLCDTSAPKGRCFLGSHLSRTRTNPDKTSAEFCVCDKLLQVTGLHLTDTFDMANRKWKFLCIPTPDFLARDDSLLPLIAMTSNIGITGLLTLLTLSVFQRINKSRQFTAELIASRQMLQDEISERKKAEKKLQFQTELLNSISKAQSLYITKEDPQPVFDMLLETLVSMTESEYGFLDEVHRDLNGRSFKKSLSLSNISWDDESRQLYEQLRNANLEFRNLNNLAGIPAITNELIIANNPDNDPRSGGLPKGHPSINSYMGIPMFFGGELLGVAGVANRQGGYTEEIASSLDTFVSTCAGIIHAIRKERKEKQIVEELRQSEEKFRELAETIDDVFWITSLGQYEKIEYVSDAFRKIWGKEPEELYNDSRLWTKAIHPDDRREIVESFEGFIRGENEYDVEFRILRNDGSIRWIWDRGFKVFDGNSRVARIMGLAQDITNRKKAEEKLRQYDHIVSSSTDMLALLDKRFVYMAANSSYLKAFGKTSNEVIGHKVSEVFGKEFFETVIKLNAEQCLTGKEVNYQACFHFPAYEPRFMDIHYYPYIDSNNEVSGFVVNGRDITRRKKAEELLRESEHRYRTLVEANPYGIQEIDTSGFITYTNPAYQKMLGYTEQELLGKSILDLLESESKRNELQDYLSELVKEQTQPKTYYQKNRTKDNRIIDMAVDWNYKRNNEGQVVGYTSVITDITERKKTEETLRLTQFYVDNSTDAVYWMGPDARFTYVNNAAVEALGYSKEELLTMTVHDIGPEFPAEVWPAHWAELKEKKSFVIHTIHQRKDESTFPVEITVNFIQFGGREINCAIAKDITERQKAEKQLQMESLMRKTILDHLPCIALILKKGTREIIASNEAARKLGAVPGKTCHETCAQRNDPCPFCNAPEVWATNEPKRKEVLYKGTYYEGIWVSLNEELYVHYIFDISDRKRAEQKVLDDQKMLKSLASELSITEERERRRIATELHDQIGQSLVFSKIKLDELHQSASSSKLTKALDEICNNIGQIIQDTRSLTFDLSSPVLNEFGLEAAVADWLDVQIGDKHGIETKFEDDGRQKPLDDDIRAILFRNVRELLVNIIKHANAKKVKVSIRRVNEHINIVVEDDGKGFNTVKVTSRATGDNKFGLFSIKERLEQLGGYFEIDSEPGRGSKFTMKTPLKLT